MRRIAHDNSRTAERERVGAALETLESNDRHVLTLLLVERLTPVETAGVLRMTVRQVEQALESLLARVAAEAGVARGRRFARRVA